MTRGSAKLGCLRPWLAAGLVFALTAIVSAVLVLRPGWGDDGRLMVELVLAAASSLSLAALARQMMQVRAHRADLQGLVDARLRRLYTAVENSPASIVITDCAGTIEYVNPQFEQSTGYTSAEAIGQNPRILKSGKRSPDEYAGLWATISAGGVWRGEFENVRKDGSHFWEMASIAPIRAEDGRVEGFVAVKEDITQQKQAEERMREALVVFNACSQGIMTTDAQGVITSVNPAFCAITGYAQDEVIGHKSSIFKSGRHDASFYEQMWATLIRAGAWDGEIWNRRKNGDTYPQWLTISAVRDAEGKVAEYVSLFSDITERKQQEQAIWRQANFDPLTGLANRSLLMSRLEHALAQGLQHNDRKLGLMFIDLDGFKWINDTLGHDVGDQLLIEVAHRLKGCVREQDTVARLGGDEFTVIVQDVADADTLGLIAEKLVGVLRDPFTLGTARHHVSGSVGITVFPDDGDSVQTLLRNADIAMYQAKQAGKNCSRFYASHMQTDALARIQLEADLRAAVEERQFVLHYQPIVELVSGELVGVEALIRWRHPHHGMLAPASFMSVAEDSGLIVPMGEWALAEAVTQATRWQDAGHRPLRLSMNVSSVQLREPGLPEHLHALLQQSGLARERLMLEIKESVLIDGSEYAEARMREIREHGVVYALDDFGTGFSSLSCLKRFPVDMVKIDSSFVRHCSQNHGDASLIEAIINMARSLNLRVTAEGVETREQMDFLRRLGCDYVQGFFIGMPVVADEFAAFMGTWNGISCNS